MGKTDLNPKDQAIKAAFWGNMGKHGAIHDFMRFFIEICVKQKRKFSSMLNSERLGS